MKYLGVVMLSIYANNLFLNPIVKEVGGDGGNSQNFTGSEK